MPTSKRTHEEHCLHICFCCLKKVKDSTGKKKDGVLILQDLKDLIESHVYCEYTQNQNILPKVVCTTCRLSLKSQSSSKPRKLPPKVDNLLVLSV